MTHQALLLDSPATAALGDALRAALAARALLLDSVRSASALLQALDRGAHEVVVLAQAHSPPDELFDTLLGLQDGPSVIVVLPGHDAAGRTAWLDRGADDAVGADVDVGELAARVQAAARRTLTRRQPRRWLHGPLVLTPEGRRVSWMDREVALTVTEFELLAHLVRGARQTHSREDLQAALSARAQGGASNLVAVHVHSLRRKLHPRLIRSVRGLGYRLADPDAWGAAANSRRV